METSLFRFIWKHSKRQQIGLLLFTLAVFPFIYASLELPKRIINDAIGAQFDTIDVFGYELTQIQYLMVLSFAFLGTVLISGLMKMRLNTMKGVLAERMLRRLRFDLINRMMRFPRSYFRTTSQGEIVSMVTAESEPMGGLMGDAVAQPVFQAGQMLTILVFLFAQNPWFGLAAIALIPVQAYLIPMLQRQINLLNKSRIQEVRKLAAEIGETAQGAGDLRENGGWRYRQAQISERLGTLFGIRFVIYKKKFFMKFLNNFITQLTPFLFYSIGGYLAIKGDITVGALVAALAAYKDLSSPWKELLAYYNQTQDMSLRWQIVIDKFAPPGMVRAELFEGEPEHIPNLRGEIEFENVTVRDGDGNTILEDISLTIPPRARVAIKTNRPSERAAIAQLLTRELAPVQGSVVLSGYPLAELHQAVVAARIGSAHSRPTIFDGTIGDNLLMPLRVHPIVEPEHDQTYREAQAAGNRPDPVHTDWVDPALAGLDTDNDVRTWWFELVQAMGLSETMFSRVMDHAFDVRKHPDLVKQLINLRPKIRAELDARGLADQVYFFDPKLFNPTVPLGANLTFAVPIQEVSTEDMSRQRQFNALLEELDLSHEIEEMSLGVLETLRQTFGRGGTDHPLFRRLGLEPERYLKMMDLMAKRDQYGPLALTKEENALLITSPFVLTAEQIGSGFPRQLRDRIVAVRQSHGHLFRETLGDAFVEISDQTYLPMLTVTENLLFGRIGGMAGKKTEEISQVVRDVVRQEGLMARLCSVVFDGHVGLGGANLPPLLQERIAFSRSAIKKPDILVMDTVLASHDATARADARTALRNLMPETTMIFMEDDFNNPENYDLFVEIKNGRIDGISRAVVDDADEGAASDLRRKLAAIGEVEVFQRLSRKNQRLLAFAGQWYKPQAGEVIFDVGDTADAVYLCVKGLAELYFPDADSEGDTAIATVEPGRVIGDLAVIEGKDRTLRLVAKEDSVFLRIGAEEYFAVIQSDAKVAMSLLQTVAGYLSNTATALQEVRKTEEGRAAFERMVNQADED